MTSARPLPAGWSVSWSGCPRHRGPRRLALSPTSCAAGPTRSSPTLFAGPPGPGLPGAAEQLAARLARGTRASPTRAVDQLPVLELTVVDAARRPGRYGVRRELRRRGQRRPGSRPGRPWTGCAALGCCGAPTTPLRAVSVLSDLLGDRFSRLGPYRGDPAGRLRPLAGPALARDLGLAPTGDRHGDLETVADGAGGPGPGRDPASPRSTTRPARSCDHLEREGKDGSVESTERPARAQAGGSPVDQLLARGLLVARDRRHVAVPREVAVCLRGGRTTRPRADVPPSWPRLATRRWSTGPRPRARRSSWSGTSSCSWSTGAPRRRPRCAPAGSASAT